MINIKYYSLVHIFKQQSWVVGGLKASFWDNDPSWGAPPLWQCLELQAMVYRCRSRLGYWWVLIWGDNGKELPGAKVGLLVFPMVFPMLFHVQTTRLWNFVSRWGCPFPMRCCGAHCDQAKRCAGMNCDRDTMGLTIRWFYDGWSCGRSNIPT